MDFVGEVSTNRKCVYLNSPFCGQHDFSEAGVSAQQKRSVIEKLKEAWDYNRIEVPLPAAFK